ncbi:hypothetical protein [Pseudomonas aeruginosa]|uniref:hypothetical protein n=1 Tax=Pseudomonas aeruginosa TaxID=287 RepID=UPI000AC8468D|nr:hypothetical protein [Pseudomonas aeruginosa]
MSKELNKATVEQAGGDERAAFEYWASDEGLYPKAVERAGNCYKLAQTQSYWMAWQARAALAQPSPTHAEQAEGAQEVPSPVSQEYDRHLISLLRKGEALPGHQEEAADEIERLRDWNDHLNNTVLPNILNPNFLMLMKGGERLLDLCTKDGKFIGVSLNDMKDVFDWMVTHARIAPDHAALAQHSPASDLDPLNLAPHAETFNEAPAEALKPEQAEAERPEVAEVAFVLRNIGAMDAEDIDGDNVDLRFEDAEGRDTGCDVSIVEYAEKAADLFEQHERIVGELRAELQSQRERNTELIFKLGSATNGWGRCEKERDAANERADALEHRMMGMMTRHFAETWRNRDTEKALDGYLSAGIAQLEQERDAALAEVERLRESKGDPSGSFDRCMKMMYERDENAKRLDAALARMVELEKQEPVAEVVESDGTLKAVITRHSYATKLPVGTKLYTAPVAQAQHSVPEGWRIERSAERIVVMNLNNGAGYAAARDGESGIAESVLYLLAADLLAAAPGKEGM